MNDQPAAAPTWNDVPTLDDPPADGDGYYELTETGWDALIGWFAGVDRMARCLDRLPHRYPEVCTDRHGTRERTVARSVEDQQSIDDSINEYLGDAGVPARPSGYRWFLRLPAGYSGEQVESTVIRAVGQLPADYNRPSQFAPCIRETLQNIYADS